MWLDTFFHNGLAHKAIARSPYLTVLGFPYSNNWQFLRF